MRQKDLFWIFSLVLLVALPVAEAESPDTAAKIKIGIILPLSGEAASLGSYAKNGIELAYHKLPAAARARVTLLYEDDQLKPAMAVTAAHRLIEQENVKVIFTMSSGIGNAVAPIAEQEKVLMIAICASDAKVSRGRHFVFTHWITPETEASELTKELVKRDYKRLGFIGQEHEGVIAVYNAQIAALKQAGLLERLVLDKKYLPDVRDFKSYIAQARAAKVDAFLVALLPGALSTFARQTQVSGIEAPLVGFEMFEDSSEVKAANGALLNQWYVNASQPSSSFIAAYQQTYGAPPEIGAPNSYDALMLAVDSVSTANGDTLEAANILRKLHDYSGAAGTYSATGDNRFSLPAEIKIVKEAGFETLYR
ncbi:MAG: ABC transporter substrate-binding protein [Oligoflexia bacterium]|nr:ABC transporter substrate-binding protein [Oligoflexia bacterium]